MRIWYLGPKLTKYIYRVEPKFETFMSLTDLIEPLFLTLVFYPEIYSGPVNPENPMQPKESV